MKTPPRLRAAALALATSCAPAAAPSGPDVADVPAVSPRGVYFVPPRGPASTYAVGDVTWRVEGGEARLDYTLPRMLVGRSERVSFRGAYEPGGTSRLRGDKGTAACAQREGALRCDERFVGLEVDLEGVRREAARADPSAVEARVAVSRGFAVEPIGVLEAPAR